MADEQDRLIDELQAAINALEEQDMERMEDEFLAGLVAPPPQEEGAEQPEEPVAEPQEQLGGEGEAEEEAGDEAEEIEIDEPAPVAEKPAPAVVLIDPILTPNGAEMKGLSCQICYDPFNLSDRIPKLFACGHTFCLSCVKELLNNRNLLFVTTISCPTCRQNTKYTMSSDPTKVPNNFNLVSMLEQREEELKAAGEKIETLVCFECHYYFSGKEVTLCSKDCQPGLDGENLRHLDSIKRVQNLLICRDCIKEKHARHNYVPFEKVAAQYEANKKIISCEQVLEKELKFADDLLLQLDLTKKEVLEHRRRMMNAIENIREEANHPLIYDYLTRFKDAAKASGDMFKTLSARLITFDRMSKARYYRTFGTDQLHPIARVYVKPDVVEPKREPVAPPTRQYRRAFDHAGPHQINGPFGNDMFAAMLPFEFDFEFDRLNDDLFGDFMAFGGPRPNPPGAAANAQAGNPVAPAAAPAPAPQAGAAPPAPAPAAAAVPAAAANAPAANPAVPNDPAINMPADILGGRIAFRAPFGLGGFPRRRREQRNVRDVHQELQNALVENPFIGEVAAVRNVLAALEDMRGRDEFDGPFGRPAARRRRDPFAAPILGENNIHRQIHDFEQRVDGLRAEIDRIERMGMRQANRRGRLARRMNPPNPGPWVDHVIEHPLLPRPAVPGQDPEAGLRIDIDMLVFRLQDMVRNEAHAQAALAGRPVANPIEMPAILNPEANPDVPDWAHLQAEQVRPFHDQLRALELELIQQGRQRRARAARAPLMNVGLELAQERANAFPPVNPPEAAVPAAQNEEELPEEPAVPRDRAATPPADEPANKRERLE